MFAKTLSTLALSGLAFASLPASDAFAAPSTQDVTLTNIIEQLVPTKVLKGDREFDGHGPDVTTTVNISIVDGGRKLQARVYFKAKETQHDWSYTKDEWARTVYTAPAGRTIKRIVGAVEDGAVISSPTCIGSSAGRCVSSTSTFTSAPASFQILMPTESWVQWIEAIAGLMTKVMQAEHQLNDGDQPTPAEQQAMEIVRKIAEGKAYITSQGNYVHVVFPQNHGPVHMFAIVGDTGGPDISTDSNGADDTRINAITFRPLRVELE